MSKMIDTENKELMKLFEEIQYCENIKKYYSGEITNCYKIIECQREKEESFQLPEPWNGDIINAPILIISSNPSINKEEVYPTKEWTKEKRIDFYFNRFQSEWTKDEKYIKLKNGNYRKKSEKFWTEVKGIVEEIMEKENIILGKDIALMEVVRCKSEREEGVKKAVYDCSRKFLEKTLASNNSKIIICTGKKAKDMLKKIYKIEENKIYFENIIMGNKKRDLLFVGHPGSNCKRKPSSLIKEGKITESDLKKIKSKLK